MKISLRLRTTAKRFEMVLPVIQYTVLKIIGDSKSQRSSLVQNLWQFVLMGGVATVRVYAPATELHFI